MAVITWPAALKAPAEFSISQARYDTVENSDATGSQSARLFGPPRWRVSLRSIDAFSLRDAGVYEAMLLQLRGGINHLALHDPVRAQPQGTLRGSPTLASTAAAGATTLSVGGAVGRNLLIGGGFEQDVGADSVADAWELYQISPGLVQTAAGVVAGNNSAGAQRLNIIDLSISSCGVRAVTPANVTAGLSYTLAADVRASNASHNCALYITWINAANAVIADALSPPAPVGTGWARYSLTATPPALAVRARCHVLFVDGLGVPDNFLGYIDNAQFELAPGSAYESNATLQAGDWLQVGTGLGTSQLLKCVADTVASDLGVMAVSVEPPLRQQFTAGTPVAWDRPVSYYKQMSTPQWSYRPGEVAKQGGFALDLLEAFS